MAIKVSGISSRDRIQPTDRVHCWISLYNRTRSLVVKHFRIHITPQSPGVTITRYRLFIPTRIDPGQQCRVPFGIVTKRALPGINYLLFDIIYDYSRIRRRKLYHQQIQLRRAFRVFMSTPVRA